MSRPWRGLTAFNAIAVVFVLTLALLAASLHRAPLAAAATTPFGVASIATLIPGGTDGLYNDALAIRLTGAKWIRIVMSWNLTEPSPGVFSWDRTDSAVTAAAQNGLNILVVMTGPAPLWAQAPGADPQAIGGTPANPATFGNFARQLASRYRQFVAAWEVWNEPNAAEFFAPLDVGKYAAMLQSAYLNIHAVQPQAIVMSGGLSSAPQGIPSVSFVTQLYDRGAGNYFDAVGLHPYTYPYAITQDPNGRGAAIPNTYSLMASRGNGQKKIWLTEFGQATGTSQFAVNEQRQSQILVDILQRASTVPFLGPTFLFTTRDLTTNPADANFNYGLYTVDFRPKAAVAAIKALNPG